MYEEELYKKSWDIPLLSCVSQDDIPKILAEKYKHLMAHTYNCRVFGPETYELDRVNGDAIPRTWHASKLVKYYV
ncbi:hypothetical protein LIER_09715 [Lithospermum erythrorhizon]|uniref:Uncharacterized protein n=1 Tax=Lithospermum erythrorhizon TaxID=34254 RepID=A0AAV3PHW4_LITER